MLNKLKDVENRYQEISLKLTDPSVIADNEQYRSLMREYKNLTPIVEKYQEYRRASDAHAEAKELLAEGGRVESVTYDPDRYGTNSATSHYYAKDAQALYEAMKEDLLAGDIGARSLSMDRNMGVKRNLELTL